MASFTAESITKLLDQYLAICNSDINQRNAEYWTNSREPWLIERWRGISARSTGAFTLALDIAGYATVLGIDCPAYYSDATAQLHEQLRYHLWESENLKCNRFFDKTIFVSFGACYSASLFGAQAEFPPGQAPWADLKNPLIKNRSDLDRMNPIELDQHGLAPRAHEFYQCMCELTQGTDIKVMYPIILRGPFSIATQLRETTTLLMDMIEAPQFVHDLMRRVTDGLKRHAQLRSEFLNEPLPPAKLFNDEIGTPMISRALYEEFILPYELELAHLHGRVHYWHSCGACHELYESISTIPGLEMMHVGPWSDVAQAAEVFGKADIALDICVSATGDVYDRTPDEMRQKLQSIKDACHSKVRYAVRADGFQILRSVAEDLASVNAWNQAAIDVLGSYPPQ